MLGRIDDAAVRQAKKVETSRTLTNRKSDGSDEDHYRNDTCGEESVIFHQYLLWQNCLMNSISIWLNHNTDCHRIQSQDCLSNLTDIAVERTNVFVERFYAVRIDVVNPDIILLHHSLLLCQN